jgi:hypothetical protein
MYKFKIEIQNGNEWIFAGEASGFASAKRSIERAFSSKMWRIVRLKDNVVLASKK